MKNNLILILSCCLIVILFSQNINAEEKLAQTGFQFLSINPDARAAAMGDAMTTVKNYSSALYINPALLAEMNYNLNFVVSQNNWIADIKHNAFSFGYNPVEGKYGVFGITFLLVDYGDVEGTIVAKNEQGFIETGIITPSAYVFGLGYAKKVSEKFSIGMNIKSAMQYLGPAITKYSTENYKHEMKSNELSTLVFDFGTLYKTGFKSFSFGMSVRNFSKEIKYVQKSFQLPLTFAIGISMNIMDLMPEEYQSQYLLVSIDAMHPRSHPEYISMGIEYRLLDLFSLRLGYKSNVGEQNISYGFGVEKYGLNIDYSYTPFGIFDNVQRFTLKFRI